MTEHTRWRTDLGLVLLLLLVGGGVKGWLLGHTEVLSRDGIGYVLYAVRLDREPWPTVLRTTHQHPLYAMTILGMSKLVQAGRTELDVLDWQLSAQLANLLCGVLLVLPMYFLGKELFDRRVGFGAALVFQVLPVAARVTADALSEGVYLFSAALALLCAAWGLRTRRVHWFFWSGLAGGLAYLARPEGALVVAATGLILFAVQLAPRRRQAWTNALASAGCLAVGSVLVVGPYCGTIGRLSGKPSAQQILNAGEPEAEGETAAAPGLLFAARFSQGTEDSATIGDGMGPALYEVLGEINQGFHYVGWLPVVFGFFWFRRRWLNPAGLGLLAVLMALQFVAISRLAVTLHYVSQRHTLIIVLCGLIFGIGAVSEWLRDRPLRNAKEQKSGLGRLPWYPSVVICLLVLFLGGCLFRTLRPLHSNRIPHREVGFWLAHQLEPADGVVDPYGWSKFYAGRVLTRWTREIDQSTRQYLVVDPADGDQHRQRLLEEACPRAERGPPVYCWPDATRPKLLVYRVDPPHAAPKVAARGLGD